MFTKVYSEKSTWGRTLMILLVPFCQLLLGTTMVMTFAGAFWGSIWGQHLRATFGGQLSLRFISKLLFFLLSKLSHLNKNFDVVKCTFLFYLKFHIVQFSMDVTYRTFVNLNSLSSRKLQIFQRSLDLEEGETHSILDSKLLVPVFQQFGQSNM